MLPSGAEVTGRGRPTPHPRAEAARRVGAASHSAVESMRQAPTVAWANPPSALVLTDDREQSGPHATVAADRILIILFVLFVFILPQPARAGAAVGNAIESLILFFRSMATAVST